MKLTIPGLLAMGLLLAISIDANAYSLDTGIVARPDASSPIGAQVRAGQFVLSGPATINSLGHWMTITQPGSISFEIYSDSSGLPGSSLFSEIVAVSPTTDPAWVGPSGLNWSLASGTYWIYTFNIGSSHVDFTTPFCFPTADPGCINSPLSKEVRYRFFDSTWVVVDGREGWRINVPEPGTLALLGLGLAGLGLSRRRKAN